MLKKREGYPRRAKVQEKLQEDLNHQLTIWMKKEMEIREMQTMMKIWKNLDKMHLLPRWEDIVLPFKICSWMAKRVVRTRTKKR